MTVINLKSMVTYTPSSLRI